jgi:two-component system LytT family response regulator
MGMRWQAVLVDDERLARSELRELLRPHTDVAVVGEASDVAGAAERVHLTGANLVFLDIQLRGESGFDLLERLPESVAVVFVTAFDTYAVQAFDVHAVDYLLKSVAPDRLADMLRHLSERGRHLVKVTPEIDEGEARPPHRERLGWTARLFLRLDDRMGFLAVSQIRAVLADGDQAVIHTLDGRCLQVRKPCGSG